MKARVAVPLLLKDASVSILCFLLWVKSEWNWILSKTCQCQMIFFFT